MCVFIGDHNWFSLPSSFKTEEEEEEGRRGCGGRNTFRSQGRRRRRLQRRATSCREETVGVETMLVTGMT